MKGDPGQARLRKHEHYEIRLKGHVDEHWSEWFDNLAITHDEDDNTILAGPVADQSALHGLLKKVHDLGLRLISVTEAEANSSSQRQSAKGKGQENGKRSDSSKKLPQDIRRSRRRERHQF